MHRKSSLVVMKQIKKNNQREESNQRGSELIIVQIFMKLLVFYSLVAVSTAQIVKGVSTELVSRPASKRYRWHLFQCFLFKILLYDTGCPNKHGNSVTTFISSSLNAAFFHEHNYCSILAQTSNIKNTRSRDFQNVAYH